MNAQFRPWVGGEHQFRLTLGNLRALQSACDAGPHEIFERVAGTNWRVDDLFETIRQGLIGGGMSTAQAGPLVTQLFEQHPLHSFKPIATIILLSALVGDDEGEDEGKAEGVEPPAPENGSSPKSMETAQ